MREIVLQGLLFVGMAVNCCVAGMNVADAVDLARFASDEDLPKVRRLLGRAVVFFVLGVACYALRLRL